MNKINKVSPTFRKMSFFSISIESANGYHGLCGTFCATNPLDIHSHKPYRQLIYVCRTIFINRLRLLVRGGGQAEVIKNMLPLDGVQRYIVVGWGLKKC